MYITIITYDYQTLCPIYRNMSPSQKESRKKVENGPRWEKHDLVSCKYDCGRDGGEINSSKQRNPSNTIELENISNNQIELIPLTYPLNHLNKSEILTEPTKEYQDNFQGTIKERKQSRLRLSFSKTKTSLGQDLINEKDEVKLDEETKQVYQRISIILCAYFRVVITINRFFFPVIYR